MAGLGRVDREEDLSPTTTIEDVEAKEDLKRIEALGLEVGEIVEEILGRGEAELQEDGMRQIV